MREGFAFSKKNRELPLSGTRIMSGFFPDQTPGTRPGPTCPGVGEPRDAYAPSVVCYSEAERKEEAKKRLEKRENT